MTSALVATVQCIILVAAVFGNVLVIVAVFRFRRMSTVANYLIASLAVADLAVAILVMPFSVITGASRDGWLFGDAFCRFWMSCDVTCCTASILHLCVIAGDRCLCVLRPLKYPVGIGFCRRTGRTAVFTIVVVWTCSLLMSFVPIHVGWHAVDDSTTGSDDQNTNVTVTAVVTLANKSTSTNSYKCDLKVNRMYAVVSSVLSFYLPLVVLVAVYSKIYQISYRHSKNIRCLEKSIVRLPQADHGGEGGGRADHRIDRKAIKTLGTLVGLFCVSWFPFFVIYLVRAFAERGDSHYRVPNAVIVAVTWLGYANSAINPCVYGFFNREFRYAYRKLILCCKQR